MFKENLTRTGQSRQFPYEASMNFTFHFSSYIAEPYWPEREQVVSILKQSGYNRAQSQDRREAALLKYLDKIGMTIENFHSLEKMASRPWYTTEDGKILIPRHQISGCLVQACQSAPAGSRIPQDELRSILKIGDFVTKKTDADAKEWSRFILPTDGKGNKLSNQRRLTVSRYIEDFDAEGIIEFSTADIKTKAVVDLLKHAGKRIGCGASRKMGYGRFEVKDG